MSYEWVFLSLLSAGGQALGWALKKKTLENTGVNNTLGCVSPLVGGVLFALIFGTINGWTLPAVTTRFVVSMSIVIVANVVAASAVYRALDRSPMSLLMPFFAVTSLGVVPIEFLVRGLVPNALQIFGMAVLVVGSVVLSAKVMPDKTARRALSSFSIAIICYSIAIPFYAAAVEESRSGLFSVSVFLLGVAAGFVPLIILSKETRTIAHMRESKEWGKVLWLMVVAGIVSALLENGPSAIALLTAKASEVYGLKRTMPFFALILGIVMFREKVTKRHVAGTALLVVGSMLVVWFR